MLKQISVFLSNTPGILAKFTKILLDNNINLKALSVSETADFGILRILVDKTDECVKILKESNYLTTLTDVVAVEIPDNPGAFYEVAKILGDNNVNIEYLYSTLIKENAMIVLRVDNNEKAVGILNNNGIKTL